MKWAPNKRLHFEVAVIKAIQTLNQVTLNEVIENLAALRDGKEPALEPQRKTAKSAIEKRTTPQSTTVTAKEEAIDPKEAWRKTVEKVRATRRLIAGWVEAGTALGVEGRFLMVGFPPEQKTAMESVASPRTRDFLEALLKEVGGPDLNIKFLLKEGLPVVSPPETPI